LADDAFAHFERHHQAVAVAGLRAIGAGAGDGAPVLGPLHLEADLMPALGRAANSAGQPGDVERVQARIGVVARLRDLDRQQRLHCIGTPALGQRTVQRRQRSGCQDPGHSGRGRDLDQLEAAARLAVRRRAVGDHEPYRLWLRWAWSSQRWSSGSALPRASAWIPSTAWSCPSTLPQRPGSSACVHLNGDCCGVRQADRRHGSWRSYARR
jgi:hypothetical protein